jgi:hypothetical protein
MYSFPRNQVSLETNGPNYQLLYIFAYNLSGDSMMTIEEDIKMGNDKVYEKWSKGKASGYTEPSPLSV